MRVTASDKSRLPDTWLWKYREAIRSGEIIAGEELICELDRLIADLDNPDFYYDTEKADLRMLFMEHCIRLTKSPYYGKPMKLMLWQKAFIEAIYSFKLSDSGNDRFQRIILLIARKNTKSETTSALLLTELCIGEMGMDIVCSSNDDTQAGILYEAIDVMRRMIDPDSLDTWRNQSWIRNKITNSKVFKLSDTTRNKEGRNIDLAGIDEVHEMKDSVVIKSIEQSQSLKENPKLIIITTEGFVNDGFLDAELIRDRQIIRGEIDDPASKRTTAWLYTQDSEDEIWQGDRDNRLWMKSNPTLGTIKRYDYLEQQIALARNSKEDRAFVLSKDFNIKQSNADAWLMYEDYMYDASFDPEDFRNALVLGAVDIAETTDLCCAKLLMMNPNDNRKFIFSCYWIPQGKLDKGDLDLSGGAKYEKWQRDGYIRVVDGNYVDTTVIADWFYEMYKTYGWRLYKCGYDVRFSTDFVKRMDDYGLDTEIVYQSPIVMSQPMKMVEADLKDRLIIGNNEMDKWCFSNTSLQLNSQGLGLAVKIDGQATRKIDGAVTTIILYEIYRRYRLDFTNNLER